MTQQDWQWVEHAVLRSVHEEGHKMQERVLAKLRELGWDESQVFGVRLALEEAFVNAIKHGNRNDEEKSVHFSCKIASDRLWVQLIDEGQGFDPATVADCCHNDNLGRPCGRGLMLMRSFMSNVEFHDQGKRVVMEKARDAVRTNSTTESP